MTKPKLGRDELIADDATISRFLSYCSAPNENGCIIWGGGLRGADAGKERYGAFYVKETTYGAHRAAWILFKGKIPDGLLVCHHCDVRACVNSDHLFLGTYQDNVDDMYRKGRNRVPGPVPSSWVDRIGEQVPSAVLTEKKVLEIRHRYAAGQLAKDIAIDFGMSRSAIGSIVRGETWSHLAGPISSKSNFFSSDEVEQIKVMRSAGIEYARIAVALGRPRESVFLKAKKLGITKSYSPRRNPAGATHSGVDA